MRTKLENRKHASCPGTHTITTPELSIKKCPECDGGIEIFSDETQATCAHCGTIVYRDINSCIQWCKHAQSCIGEEEYRRLANKK